MTQKIWITIAVTFLLFSNSDLIFPTNTRGGQVSPLQICLSWCIPDKNKKEMRSKKSPVSFFSLLFPTLFGNSIPTAFFAVKRSSLQDLPLPPYMIYNNPPPGVAIHVIECGKKKTSNDVCSAVIERTAVSAQLKRDNKRKESKEIQIW